MIKIDNELIKKLEKLSNIELKDNEEIIIKNDLNNLLNYMSLLDNIDVSDEEELFSPIKDELKSITHEDIPEKFKSDDIINNFPEKNEKYLKVPGIHN
ncbi:Asp-tRNA(Asn)/Glu-tRNA(Gln) amidotransferase subunit GatC [Oceanotoga sp. DSM 15011]|jgi:aspartyl-tRNA(Asn)/glutamyl-tRNA(Gln) amidotransferase subunit C|uniref:Aspartyl/glutamyl-tRNA(Asn/Gln) amidotransferase subunit C n=1 Tax=Oceanotoga teriensis TaxID=515440 RepID=A0AA45HHM3_9BACT|nr:MULTISPECIES: Asp-tRNA(Asn)/Glu-tRNA(Gln) amidotransferase subunit GatC [Oceanotoga]MDO7977681.1 Asp-tRNA(Asn)/Glu-tRNA(Gln) amidotransferase subunit GatC [Oceanotoga teriensis]PWJ87540.1 aspartyl/glutamyl-tRNA(Asn/Gln) amidotransferase subunit C [Oceanotoga teriensis]UYO99636.1 Asp-tRNA(Asn)/Glu-tRNA(Gln) amidotransferase subunit GatC [Oceanotoga sp. DSM 15011]